ncbi:hypothetical protein BCD64_22955 [Nostoc sp. MBR 210]|uniref:Uncharacterized protein n=1 Tax=Nostoc spongiaeforme FACHB-130 TaxID=1357510 RepID=A0ABR8FTR5_9NOSO|nr:hypothetical protein [Nostoc spongiaeforme]MBD2593710.1 hypothetical protein [Nostoc spongiaeforme FACHB-130]OCQ98904.1 hypothetical protein BCD64_22955 [Nostoc sp. MBR 210]
MRKQKFVFGFLTAVATFGLVSSPTLAQVNSNQGASQTAAINGNNNTIIQIINQTSRQQNNRGRVLNRRQLPNQRRGFNRNQEYGRRDNDNYRRRDNDNYRRRDNDNDRRDRGNHYGRDKKYRYENRWNR